MMFTSGLLLGVGIGMIATVFFYSFILSRAFKIAVKEKNELLKYWNLSTENQADQIEVLRDILDVIDHMRDGK